MRHDGKFSPGPDAVGKPGTGSSIGPDDVVVRDFQPDRGVAVLEFGRQRVRYTREKTSGQVVAMADYLRARRGFSTDQQMAEILGVHRSRLIAWKQGMEVPNPANAHLLSHLAVVVQELEEFLDPDVISDWLLTEQYTLGGRTPVQALRDGHLAEVLQTANATEHGAYI
jgi:transcriptional regulator with XRE-family HTH domain